MKSEYYIAPISIFASILIYIVLISVVPRNDINQSVLSLNSVSQNMCDADYNGDGNVNLEDFRIFSDNYKKNDISCSMDLSNEDCYLDIRDFVNFAKIYSSSSINCSENSENSNQNDINADYTEPYSENTVTGTEFSEIKLGNPWVYPFSPLNQYYVSSSGIGGGALNTTGSPSIINMTFDDINYSSGKIVSPGQNNQALEFDGDGDHINLSSPVGSWSQGFTFESWIKLTDISDRRSIINNLGSASSGGHGMSFRVDTDGKLSFYVSENALNGCQDRAISLKGNTIVSDGQWHHVALVVDRSTNQAIIYLDGNQDSTSMSLDGVVSSGCGINDLKYIGIDPYQLNDPFLGSMDELNLFNYAFSLDQIEQAYNN